MPVKLPPVRDAADLAGTMTAIIAAAGEGAISPDERGRLARLVEIFPRAVETRDFERRLQLYVEIGDGKCVGLDEVAARLDEVAHQGREGFLGRVGVVDLDLQ